MKERLIDIRAKYQREAKKVAEHYNTKYCIDLDRCATRMRISSIVLSPKSFEGQNDEISETQKMFLLSVVRNWLQNSKKMNMSKTTAKILIKELLGDSWVWSNLE